MLAGTRQKIANVTRILAVHLMVFVVSACNSNGQQSTAPAWVGWVEHGCKPGVGYAFTDDAAAPTGFVYVMDPDAPGDFSKSMRARMEDLTVSPTSARFAVRFPGVPPETWVLEFPDGRAGETATANLPNTGEKVPFRRAPIPAAMGDYDVTAKAEEETTWEGIPEKPTDPWGIRLKARGEKVTEATLYIFDPKFPRDFSRAFASPAIFDDDTQYLLGVSFQARGPAGENMKMYSDATDVTPRGGKYHLALALESPSGDRVMRSEYLVLRRQ